MQTREDPSTVQTIFAFALIASLFFVHNLSVFAQDNVAQSAVDAKKQQLENELALIEQEIKQQKAILDTKQREKVSVERDVSILNAQIQKARLNIRAQDIKINNLSEEIDEKTVIIGDLSEKIQRTKRSLAQLIRKTDEIDNTSIIEVVLGSQDISDFFLDIDSFNSIKQEMHKSFDIIRETQNATEYEKELLAQRQALEADARAEMQTEKRVVERNEIEKTQILNALEKEEKTYAQIVKEREARAAEIRATLFALRGTAAIPFGEALEYANKASNKTGVRTAFILGILKQESNLGENVGTCNRPGDPPSKNWENIMKPSRDHEPYLRITSALGLDPNTMPLSCPWGNGWGGAMGPSQFIPSTWEMYADRIAASTGHNPPNPWVPEDAIMATATFLADLGASRGGYTAELEAALRYYAGGNWNKPKNRFYGEQVLEKARDIQENMIDPLQRF